MSGRYDKPRDGFTEYWLEHQDSMSQNEMADEWEVDNSTVSRWVKWLRRELGIQAHWKPPRRTYTEDLWELTEDDIPVLLKDFLAFRERHFKTPRGVPFSTEPFHERWILAFLTALVTGSRLVILSPPRHGKTELLIHFATWLIVRFPMIRILWVGGNEIIAKRSVAQVQTQLTTNTEMVLENLGPERHYKPEHRGGLPWTKTEFTVANRPFPVKGTSMTALGRGGTLLSLDADIIIADDIEDHKSTIQPGMREQTREWWTSQLESRKMADTALCLIGSRQHPDDLAGHLIGNKAYVSIVETAHSPECTLPADDPADYDAHVDCMLFPDLAPFSYLMDMREASKTTGGLAHYEMVYLNITHPKGMVIFTPEVVNKGLDRSRAIGHIPLGANLVGGLDPSGVGYQAGFLWAYTTDPFKIYMVDLENNEGGGAHEAKRLFAQWRQDYGLTTWVVEETIWATGLSKDHELMDWASQNGYHIEGHLTYQNKWDSHIGVSQFVSMYLADPVEISLPYLDAPSQQKTNLYRHQLIYFTNVKNHNTRAGPKSDLTMASWFPMDLIRRARSDQIASMGVDYEPAFATFGQSGWDEPPWGRMGSDLDVILHP